MEQRGKVTQAGIDSVIGSLSNLPLGRTCKNPKQPGDHRKWR